MNIIKTDFFQQQFDKLKRKYPKMLGDYSAFVKNIKLEPFSNLWNNVYKFRIKNSSIPTWKRWWFRIIILFLDLENIIPLFIYSKTEKENVNMQEILNAKKIILKELQEKNS